jgi:uncharacterized protein (TIGR02271 family)
VGRTVAGMGRCERALTEQTDEESEMYEDVDRIVGATAYDDSGDKIGTVDQVYIDDETREPKFALVNTGLFGLRSSFVPLRGASMDGDDLRVRFSKDRVKDAPNLDPDGHLEPQQEQELFAYYGDGDGSGNRDARTTTTSGGRLRDDQADEPTRDRGTGAGAMTRSEEELDIERSRREAGRVRLRKHVVTDHVTKTVPVQREEVHVEREPITDGNVQDATSGPDLTEDEHEVVLHEEEVDVEKRTVPKERIRLEKDVHTDEREVSEDLAREEIDVIEDGDTHR